MYGLLKGLEEHCAGRRVSAGPLQLMRTVFWSFFGVRKMRDLDSDAVSLTPLQVIGAGLIGAVILVLCLITLVRHIVA